MYALLLMLGLAGAAQAGPDFTYEVQRLRSVQKDEAGVVAIDNSGIEYRALKGKTSIRVGFGEIRQLDLSDPAAIRVETYEMLKRKLSGRRVHEFRLMEARTAAENDRLVAFVSQRVTTPIVANYSTPSQPEFEAGVYHKHVMNGCNGTLQITPEGIRFVSEKEEHSRMWRYDEVQTIGGVDDLSFRLTTSSGNFLFDLKERLPQRTRELVWRRVYALESVYSK